MYIAQIITCVYYIGKFPIFNEGNILKSQDKFDRACYKGNIYFKQLAKLFHTFAYRFLHHVMQFSPVDKNPFPAVTLRILKVGDGVTWKNLILQWMNKFDRYHAEWCKLYIILNLSVDTSGMHLNQLKHLSIPSAWSLTQCRPWGWGQSRHTSLAFVRRLFPRSEQCFLISSLCPNTGHLAIYEHKFNFRTQLIVRMKDFEAATTSCRFNIIYWLKTTNNFLILTTNKKAKQNGNKKHWKEKQAKFYLEKCRMGMIKSYYLIYNMKNKNKREGDISHTVCTVCRCSSCRKQAIVAISHVLHVLREGNNQRKY